MTWVRIPPLPNPSFSEEKPEIRQIVEVAVAMEHKNNVIILGFPFFSLLHLSYCMLVCMGFMARINTILYCSMGQGSSLSVLVRRVHVEVSISRFEVEGNPCSKV